MGMSREQMEAVIRKGGTVLYKGRGIKSIEHLPSAAAMANTPEEKKSAADDIDAQIEKLRKQKADLGLSSETDEGEKSDKTKTETGDDKTEEEQREANIKALTRKNLDDLDKIVEDMRAQGYVIEFAEGAKKEAIVEAIVDAKKQEAAE